MMKKTVFILTAFLLLQAFSLSLAAEEERTTLHVFPYDAERHTGTEEGPQTLYGLCNDAGEIVVSPRYDAIAELGGGWWSVSKAGRIGLVDPSGKRIRRSEYDAITRREDGTFVTEIDGERGLLSAEGRELLRPGTGEFELLPDGACLIRTNGKCGLLLEDGTTFVKPRFDGIEPLDTGAYRVRVKERYGLLSPKGRTICAARYEAADPWVSDGMYIARISGRELLFNENGERCDRTGGTVLLGRFDQDNDPGNGAEQIEWIVLRKDGGDLFLVSRLALGCLPFDERYVPGIQCSWSSSALREGLNGSLFDCAFSDPESEVILPADTSGDRSYPLAITDSGRPGREGDGTEDRIFLLSTYEAEKHLRSESLREAAPSASAVAQGAFLSRRLGSTNWWLRSPGQDASCAAFIDHKGRLDDRFIGYGRVAVRPAMWIRAG